MRQIIGMAKSNLDLRGAKGPKLELDFLRLVYAVKEAKRENQETKAYLLVMTEKIKNRVNEWAKKYNAEGLVETIVLDLSEDEQRWSQDFGQYAKVAPSF